jgi:predicted enzyme involved in methoxymalonyl-ACP biosynthesis
LIREANEELRSIAKEVGSAYVMDYDSLTARHGRERWSDPRT